MTRVFVDTSGWLALRDPKHAHHRPIVEWLRSFRGRLVTTSDVVDETVTLANARWGHPIARRLGERIMDPEEVQFVFVEESFFQAGWKRFQERGDKKYSLTDCTSFVVMERMDISEAMTLDKHFAQEGFRIVPEP